MRKIHNNMGWFERMRRAWLENEPRQWIKWTRSLLGGWVNNPKLKDGLMQAIPFWVASVVTGLIAASYAALFSLVEQLSRYLYEVWSWGVFVIMPLSFILGWWLVKQFAPLARGSGIPQVVAAIEICDTEQEGRVSALLSLRIILVKVLSSFAMVLGGAAIGREGPTIQIAASIFRKINEWLPAWWPKVSTRLMVMTGAGAGLAAAFNTPLGGIVFVVEELTKTHFNRFRTAIFAAVIIAGLTAQAISGPYLFLGFPEVEGYSLDVFWGILLVAILAGLLGAGISKALVSIFAWKKRLKTSLQNVAFLLVTSLMLASTSYFVTDKARGSGKDLIAELLFSSKRQTEWHVPVVRAVSSITSFSSGAAGGMYGPSLSTGASVGAGVATVFDVTPPNANMLILAGMVALLTGVTRSPFTSAILVLEMTDRHNLIFFLMAAGLIANIFAYLIDRKSLYQHLKEGFIAEVDPLQKMDQ